MLLEFRISNFKSFLDDVAFKMTPAAKQRDLAYSVMKEKIGSKEYKGLCSAVIYGPNASGKTNIIAAMDVLRTIVLKGDIRNNEHLYSSNASKDKFELIPNNTLQEKKPTNFYIKFMEENLVFEYALSLDLGVFLDETYTRSILLETLSVNEKLIYKREDDLEFYNEKVIEDLMIKDFVENKDLIKTLSKNNIHPEELFLTNGFKLMFSTEIVAIIQKWFEHKFIVIYRADMAKLNDFRLPKDGQLFIHKKTNRAAQIFGINSNALGYAASKDDEELQLYSIFDDKKTAIPADIFESYGTVRFINMFPLFVKALMDGSVLVLDEFDANIHPMALMSIINIFHDDDINTKHAQLIFNTHNPIFLNANLFRRDEIKFVERDEKTHLSQHYALSDFKTAGKSGVRKAEDYMKHYFLGRYGAIKDIDFYDLFEEILKD